MLLETIANPRCEQGFSIEEGETFAENEDIDDGMEAHEGLVDPEDNVHAKQGVTKRYVLVGKPFPMLDCFTMSQACLDLS